MIQVESKLPTLSALGLPRFSGLVSPKKSNEMGFLSLLGFPPVETRTSSAEKFRLQDPRLGAPLRQALQRAYGRVFLAQARPRAALQEAGRKPTCSSLR